MADSSFEEQVRRELEALRLKPEDQVWLNVAASLREKKKRRGFFWLLLLAALGGAMAVYFLSGTGTKNEVAQQRGNGAYVEKTTATSGRRMSQPPATIVGAVPDTPITGDNATSLIHHQNEIRKSSVTEAAARVNNMNMPPQSRISNNNAKRQRDPVNAAKIESDPQHAVIPLAPVKDGKEVTIGNLSPANTAQRSDVTDTAGPETRVAQVATPRTDTAAALPVAPAKAVTGPKASASKWQWIFSADAGIGGSVRPVSVSGGGNVYSNANTPGNPGAFLGSSNAPQYKRGLYTGLLLTALRKAGKRGSVGISVGYTDYRETVGVGSRYDTLMNFSNINPSNQARFVYRPADTASFANRYRFLQLEADYYSGFGKGSFPLRWHAGGGAAILLSGKALHYDGNTGLLFRNDDLIPGLQWFVSAGIDVAFGRKRFFAGPSFTYFLSKDSRVSTDSRHLFNASFRLGMQLGKK